MNPEDPDDGWVAAEASAVFAHRTVPGSWNSLPTFRSFAVLPSRPSANRRCMLAAYGTSHVNRSWSAGTSTPEADSTASLLDLACPLTTFAELSAAPLDCGSPSADVSCTTSPVQANFTALSNARMEGSLSHRETTLLYSKIVQTFDNHLHHLLATWEVNSFRWNQNEQTLIWSLHRALPRLDRLHAVPLQLH